MNHMMFRLLRRWGQEAIDVLLPSYCAGCQKPEATLCLQCRANLQQLTEPIHASPHALALPLLTTNYANLQANATEMDLPVLPVYATARYQDHISQLILNIKEHNKPQLCRYFAPAFQRTIERALGHTSTPKPLIVPIPATPASITKRGYWPLKEFYRHVRSPEAYGLLKTNPEHKTVGSQKHRTKAQRASQLQGSLQLDPAAKPIPEGTEAILVDDVLTTGATLAEGFRVLQQANIRVVAAAVVAATMPAATSEETH